MIAFIEIHTVHSCCAFVLPTQDLPCIFMSSLLLTLQFLTAIRAQAGPSTNGAAYVKTWLPIDIFPYETSAN